MNSVQVVNFQPHKSVYKPGAPVELLITLTNSSSEPLNINVDVSIKYLSQEVTRLTQAAKISPGERETLRLLWGPPLDAPKGYGADMIVRNSTGQPLAQAHTALDVLDSWTQAPRYGFLTDFSPGRDNLDETMNWLSRYHINGLQFYDWMYRHETYLTAEEPYQDLLGQTISRRTIDALIEAAHAHNIAAMPYTAIYGASVPFFEAHPDWALYKEDGKPEFFGEDFLVIMNPDPNLPWAAHLMREFTAILTQTEFDGIHLDQYGAPKIAYDVDGNKLDLAESIPGFINLTKETASAVKPGSNVVFNYVTNWPIETAAASRQDFIYIEVWAPYTLYQDLHKLIVNAQSLGGGRPVVLAAYIDPLRERNVQLAEAVIFASGGSHIELGEPGGILSDPYFPKYGQMSNELADVIRRYYDFALRYENILALDTRDATSAYEGRVIIEGVDTDASQAYNKVWPIARAGDETLSFSLVNMLEIASPEWNGLLLADPALQKDLQVRLYTEFPLTRLWWATPDGDDPTGQTLAFNRGEDDSGKYIEFNIPSLAYWDLIVLE